MEPTICYFPNKRFVEALPELFPPITKEEQLQEWGREMYIGIALARDFDLYRAITSFKRAKIIIPFDQLERGKQIDYYIILCYYLGNKYSDAIDVFESSELIDADETFSAYHDLLIIVHDCYMKTCQCDKANAVLALIDGDAPDTANALKLSEAFIQANLSDAYCYSNGYDGGEHIQEFISDYCRCRKSVRKAQRLNAILPGAGYYYVGLRKAALTSFLLNTLFTVATYQFIDRGYWAAGAFTASLEFGWYFGGINGAGLAAKEYNERLYEECGKQLLIQHKLFPVLMLQKSF